MLSGGHDIPDGTRTTDPATGTGPRLSATGRPERSTAPSRQLPLTLQGVLSRGARLDVTAGEEVIRRWDSGGLFYIVLSGRYDISIDGRLIRSMGPGDHFGQLAARDWGGGYGYARTATVRCVEAGQLLALTSEDFQWLVDTEPAVKARLARILAERLRQR